MSTTNPSVIGHPALPTKRQLPQELAIWMWMCDWKGEWHAFVKLWGTVKVLQKRYITAVHRNQEKVHWNTTCHFSLQSLTTLLRHQLWDSANLYLCGWRLTVQRLCSLTRCLEVCITCLRSAAITDHGQPIGNMDLIVAWRFTTTKLNCSQMPLCSSDILSIWSRASCPQNCDPSLTKYSQASTWRSCSKTNIIVDLVTLLLKITKALIKLGKTDGPVERGRKYVSGAKSWGANQQFIAKEKNMTACGKQWGLDLIRTVAEWAPHNETGGETFEETVFCLPVNGKPCTGKSALGGMIFYENYLLSNIRKNTFNIIHHLHINPD